MHKLGMKVNLYVGGTTFTETLYREIPEAKNWEQRDQWDHWIPYGIQTYRHYACPNEPAYRDYLKRVLKIGIQDLGADEIAFDKSCSRRSRSPVVALGASKRSVSFSVEAI
jgi:hypothetical protein